MAYIPYPQMTPPPNEFQIAGQAVQQVGQAFSDEQDRQAKLRAMMEEMTQRRAQAIYAENQNKRQEAEEGRKQWEFEQKQAAEKNRMDFLSRIQRGKPNENAHLARQPDPRPYGDQTETIRELENVEGLKMPTQNVGGADSTRLLGEALDREFTKQEPFTNEEMLLEGLHSGQIDIKDYYNAVKAQRAGMSLEEYEARLKLKNQYAAEQEPNRYQQERMGYWQALQKRAEKSQRLATERLGFGRDKFRRQEEEQNIDRATKFVKNTNDLESEIFLFEKLGEAIPGGLYGSGGISGFGFGTKPFRKVWKTDEAKAIRPVLQALVNKILRRESGAAVTDQEFERMETAFGINTTGTVEEFRNGLQNYYETAKRQFERFKKADPEAAAVIDQDASWGGISDQWEESEIEPSPRPEEKPKTSAREHPKAEAARRMAVKILNNPQSSPEARKKALEALKRLEGN